MVLARIRPLRQRLTAHLPQLVAGAFIVIALIGIAAVATTATAHDLIVSPVPDQVPGAGVVQPSAQTIYPQPPVWWGSWRSGMGTVEATGTHKSNNGQLVLSSSSGDIILTEPDGKAPGKVTAAGPWSTSGGQLTITVRQLIPYAVDQPLPMPGA